ncbi:MAG: deoxyribonuclease IV [Patescibacteria group bacterium]
MNIGAHVSFAGGFQNAPTNAQAIGCECFQMFTRSPQGGSAPAITPATVAAFTAACRSAGQRAVYVHTPYYINLASAVERIRRGSAAVIRDDLERASLLGARAVMTHLGSAKDVTHQQGLAKVITGIGTVLRGYRGTAQLLLEISAGAGSIIGDRFEEIGSILSTLPDYRIGVCFDTCHAFASGYDLRTAFAVRATLGEFDRTIGLGRLRLVHANDAKRELGSKVDRHEHIGLGQIGRAGFAALLKHPALRSVDIILETPKDGQEVDDILVMKKLRPTRP